MIPELKFDPKEFYIWEAVAQNSTNIPKINGILEDLVRRGPLLEYVFESENKMQMPVYEINEEGEFLPARGLQATIYHSIKDNFYDNGEGTTYASVIQKCGDCPKTIRRNIILAKLDREMIYFTGKSGTINAFWLARLKNPGNKSLGF
jgi:hypothetical protein